MARRSFPELYGKPVEVQFLPDMKHYGVVHAGSFLPQRRILLESCLRRQPRELARIFVHELFHFAWVRLGNPLRRSWEELLHRELRLRAAGELGWSAEWRKRALTLRDRAVRSRRWRDYACESFCDTAAWRFSGVRHHPEYTLAAAFRERRADWLDENGVSRRISI